MLSIIQLGMNSADMAGTLRLYSEAFGFANAGGQCVWGSTLRVQSLDDDSRALLWWMVGRQQFFQMELLQHSRPPQRPLRADWRPNDHGWVRCGIAVPDFDATLAVLAKHGLSMLGPAMVTNGLRRAAFRDPYIGSVVEVMEDGPALTGDFTAVSGEGPALVYAAASVSDLGAARNYYENILCLEISPLDDLHLPDHEALWGLPGATRSGFVARSGDIRLEIVAYQNPQGRPRAPNYRNSDQGIVNVALGSRERAVVAAAIDRLRSAGLVPSYILQNDMAIAAYITEPEREVEIIHAPVEYDSAFGFTATTPLIGSMS